MLRSVAALLATGSDYCIADVTDHQGVLRRLGFAHADVRLHPQLEIAADDAVFPRNGRVARLLASGGSERMARVTDAARRGALADIVLPNGARPMSYMSAAVWVCGAPMAVLTVVSALAQRNFGAEDLEFLVTIAEWIGLGCENALRRELQPRASIAPPAQAENRPVEIQRTSRLPAR